MNFGGFSNEDEQNMVRGNKLPFYASSSPSSSSGNYSRHHGSGYDDGGGGPDTKLELIMDSSPRDNNNNNNSNNNEDDDVARREDVAIITVEKEHMFDKVVTPSDVGKLNRLVIPKQHAEKYFPLDSSANEKGLLLNFEDRNGKPWRFRYSYWNSSQSYVMTKGWSRFVKEKKLDAGDIVSFQRGLGELGKDRLFIDWRRRPDAPDSNLYHHHGHPLQHHHHQHYPPNLAMMPHQQYSWNLHQQHGSGVPWSPLLMRPLGGGAFPRDQHLSQQQINYSMHHHHPYRNTSSSSSISGYGNVVSSGPVYYLRSAAPQQLHDQDASGLGLHQHHHQVLNMDRVQGSSSNMVLESVPVVHGKAAAKRLRLFGVNMECPMSESDHECEILSSAPSSQPGPFQLRLYDGMSMAAATTSTSTSTATTTDFLSRGKSSPSSMSLDFDV